MMTAELVTYQGQPYTPAQLADSVKYLDLAEMCSRTKFRGQLWERAADRAAYLRRGNAEGPDNFPIVGRARILARRAAQSSLASTTRAQSINHRVLAFGLMNKAASGVIRAGVRVK